MNPTIQLLHGDCRAVLRGLPECSVHCVVTSPPYWGLRAYGTSPQIWGGCATCDHQWGEELPGKRSRWGDLDSLSEKQASNRGSAEMVAALEAPGGAFCETCNAWRGELGLEPTIQLFVSHLVEVFREVRRVLRRDGTAWVNMGDCYAGTPNGWDARKYRERGIDDRTFRDKPFATTGGGLKPKDLAGAPWRLALALQDDGWWLRSDIIWHKPNPLPESITDRPTKSHEYLFLLAKAEEYFYDHEAVKEAAVSTTGSGNKRRRLGDENGRPGHHRGVSVPWEPTHNRRGRASAAEVPYADNRQSRHGNAIPEGAPTRSRRTVWTIATQSFRGAHFATYPEKLVEPCILAGTSAHGVCGLCGAPWERVTEKGEPDREWQQACGGDAEGEYHGKSVKPLPGWHDGQGSHLANGGALQPKPVQDPSEVKARILAESLRPTITTGWQPTCDCHPMFAGEPVPATVLDPFAGSATTGVVARRHGRSFVGVELQPEYLSIARGRLGLDDDPSPEPQPIQCPESTNVAPDEEPIAPAPIAGDTITWTGKDGARVRARVESVAPKQIELRLTHVDERSVDIAERWTEWPEGMERG